MLEKLHIKIILLVKMEKFVQKMQFIIEFKNLII